jgi:hypothetical protein
VNLQKCHPTVLPACTCRGPHVRIFGRQQGAHTAAAGLPCNSSSPAYCVQICTPPAAHTPPAHHGWRPTPPIPWMQPPMQEQFTDTKSWMSGSRATLRLGVAACFCAQHKRRAGKSAAPLTIACPLPAPHNWYCRVSPADSFAMQHCSTAVAPPCHACRARPCKPSLPPPGEQACCCEP